MICFFDDFGALAPDELEGPALMVFPIFCSLLGIKLKTAKSESGQMPAFLGLEGSSPCEDNEYIRSVSLTQEKLTNEPPS